MRLNSQCQITAKFNIVDKSKAGMYVTLSASNVWHSAINKQLKNKINNIRVLTKKQ